MTGRLSSAGWIAALMVTAALSSLLTPLCAMPDCGDTVRTRCPENVPARDRCPDTTIMKHTPDDALVSAAATAARLAVVERLSPSAQPVIVVQVLDVPEQTASPPPVDPLGVRLTV